MLILYCIQFVITDLRNTQPILTVEHILAEDYVTASSWAKKEADRRWPTNLGYGSRDTKTTAITEANTVDGCRKLIPKIKEHSL